ncbi:hypothetical protein STN0717ENT53_29670 [Enterobacter kobei]|nr:hypothetical protein STN0717ENT53_29670 [Enterobacter kobei]
MYFLIIVKPGDILIINAIIPSVPNVVSPHNFSTTRVTTNKILVIMYAIDIFNIKNNFSITSPKYSYINLYGIFYGKNNKKGNYES